jgi:hypothetical protein
LAGIEYHIEGIDIKDDKDRYFLEDFIHYADVFLEDIKMEDFPMERKEILDYLDAIHCQAKNLIENVEQRAL